MNPESASTALKVSCPDEIAADVAEARVLPETFGVEVPELSVTTASVGDECVLTLSGDVDMSCSERIGDLGVGTLESYGIRLLTVDLSAVTFIDSCGMGALVRMHRAALAQGKLLVLRNPSDKVRRVLSLTALDTVLPIDTSGHAARQGVNSEQ